MRIGFGIALLGIALLPVADCRAAETAAAPSAQPAAAAATQPAPAPESPQVPTVQVTPEQAAARSDDDSSNPRDNRRAAPTPDEELQQQIRMFDPKAADDRGKPASPARTSQSQDSANQSSDRRSARPNHDSSSPNPTPGATDQQAEIPESERPLPGSVAASSSPAIGQGAAFGPRVATDADRSSFTGPAVLSRSYTLNTLSLSNGVLKWTENYGASENYDTGTQKPAPGATGTPSSGTAGTTLNWSIAGSQRFTNDVINLSYSGNTSHYVSNSTYNGFTNNLVLNELHRFSRRISLSSDFAVNSLSASNTLQNQQLAPGASVADVNLALSPTIQPQDSRTRQLTTHTMLAWQRSARLSFTFSGGYFGIERDGTGLQGSSGYQAEFGSSYRYSRRTTIGAYYSYTKTLFPHGLGSSDTNTFGLNYSASLGRAMQLRLRAGISRTESLMETAVPVSPLVAALTGVPAGIVDLYRELTSSDLSAQFTRDFSRRMTGFIAYTRGITPGNGQVFTSTQSSTSAGLTERLGPMSTLQFSLIDNSLSSVGQVLQPDYKVRTAQVDLTRRYHDGFTFTTTFSYRYFGHSNPQLQPSQLHIATGITWTPGPGKLWPVQNLRDRL